MCSHRYGQGVKRSVGRHLYATDLVLACALTVLYAGFAQIPADDGQPAYSGPVWLGWLVAGAVGLPVAVRRRLPVAVLGTVLAALAAASLLDLVREPYTPAGLAAYLVGLAGPTRRSVLALAASLPVAACSVYAGTAVITPGGDGQDAVGLVNMVLLVIGGAWTAGFLVRLRRADGRRREEHRAELALAGERLRIARELHDIVSHNLSLIAVKAGVAAHVAEADPQEARSALRVIEETSRSALTDMRRTLGVLRRGAPVDPAPGLVDLDRLARDARGAGVDVDLTVAGGNPHALGGSTHLAVYRIVQEALTNVVKHAAPTSCRVTVAVERESVALEVVDEGPSAGSRPPAAGLPGGYGLMGVRERALVHGGSFTAGPRPDGGYAVYVRLPIAEETTT